MKLRTSIVFALLFAIFFIQCKNKPDEVKIAVISNLNYSPSSLNLVFGNSGQSEVPTYEGDIATEFQVTSDPASAGITIAANGRIQVASTVPIGTYELSVDVTNKGGKNTFKEIFTLTISSTATAPTGLNYNTDTLRVNQGSAGNTIVPTIDGTGPYSFSFITAPSDNGITINSTNGQISVASTVAVGFYKLGIKATNSLGGHDFNDLIVIHVKAVKAKTLSYSPTTLSIVVGNSGTSSIPTVTGTGSFTFAATVSPTQSGITIQNSDGQISVANTVPAGTYVLDITVSNSVGDTLFDNAFTVVVSNTGIVPHLLSYSTSSLTLTEGTAGQSVTPSIQGTNPITYSISTTPSSSGQITMNTSTGVISVSNTTSPGTYDINITASNTWGSATFNTIYTVVVNAAVAPSNLTYSVTALTLTQGNAGNSVTPSITGTTPINYSITVSPTESGITIHPTTGVISASNAVAQGIYQVSVTASNAGGSQVFNNVYTVNINAPLTSFNLDVKPILQSNCSGCHSSFLTLNVAQVKINTILDRVQRTQGSSGFMPSGGSSLSPANIATLQDWLDDGLQP